MFWVSDVGAENVKKIQTFENLISFRFCFMLSPPPPLGSAAVSPLNEIKCSRTSQQRSN